MTHFSAKKSPKMTQNSSKKRSGFREQPALEDADAACFFKLLDTELRNLTGREMELPPAEAISERGVAANHQSHSLPDVHPHACTRAQPAKWAYSTQITKRPIAHQIAAQ